MNDFLSFRKMITPVIIQILFWVGVVFSVLGGLVTMTAGTGEAFFKGLLTLIIGPVIVRVYCELLILLFRLYDAVDEIRRGKAAPGPAFPVTTIS